MNVPIERRDVVSLFLLLNKKQKYLSYITHNTYISYLHIITENEKKNIALLDVHFIKPVVESETDSEDLDLNCLAIYSSHSTVYTLSLGILNKSNTLLTYETQYFTYLRDKYSEQIDNLRLF